jgi:hypothetical protein
MYCNRGTTVDQFWQEKSIRYSDLPNLATFKYKILSYRVEILCGQILFLISYDVNSTKGSKNKIGLY